MEGVEVTVVLPEKKEKEGNSESAGRTKSCCTRHTFCAY